MIDVVSKFQRIELVRDEDGFFGVRWIGDRGFGSSLSVALFEVEVYHNQRRMACPLSSREHGMVDRWFEQYEA